MIFLCAAGAALGSFATLMFVLFIQHSPEFQVKKRLSQLISDAEKTRKIENSNQIQLNQRVNLSYQKIRQKSNFYSRIIRPTLDKLSEYLNNLAPIQIKNLFERQIFLAGKLGIWSVKRLILMWLTLTLLGLFTGFFIVGNVSYHPAQELLILGTCSALGAVLPILKLQAIIRTRKKQIRRQLPEFLDLLCVSVQAGLSFDGAVAKIITRMRGVIIDEFQRVLNDTNLGMSRQYALTQMARRCDLEEIYLFTASIIQAEKLGTSMSRTLKMQADNIRDRHRQYIKAQALKAPVKIIFPMVLFIFPAIFVVLLFPTILSILKTLSNN